MVKFFVVLCYILLFICAISTDDCPQLGVKGKKSFPNLLDIGDGQKLGYHALVEVNSGPNSMFINDYFNGLTGILKIKQNNSQLDRLIHYYPTTNEGYIIKNDGNCDSIDLGVSNQKKIVDLWSTLDYSLVYKVTDSLGPTGLLVYLILQRDNLQFIANNTKGFENSQSADVSTHWFTCLSNNGPHIHIHLNSAGRLINIVLSLDDATEINFNFVKLLSITTDQEKLVTYPYGLGCHRKLKLEKVIPRFAESESFMLNMQIALYYDDKLYAEEVNTLKILRYNGIYSYESLYDDSKLRIIYDPKLSIEYLIYLNSGTCSIKEATSLHSGYLKWPYANDSAFNVLSPLVLQLREDDLSYFGQKKMETKLFDIYERQVKAFTITDGEYQSASITYFISVESETNFRAPSTIEIRLGKLPAQSKPKKSVSRIRLEITDYMESDDLYDPIRFDLRNCYNEPAQSLWFQIVFSVVPSRILTTSYRQAILERYIREALNFIPMTRLPDIRVDSYGPSLYISCKLTNGPSILSVYEAQPKNIFIDPSIELIRDNDVDCAQLCASNNNCKAFSYCDNRQCNLYTGPLPVGIKQISKQCTVYMLKLLYSNGSHDVIQLNQFTSSSLLINQIKSMIIADQLTLPGVGKADHMFIVSSPYELGSYGDPYDYDDSKTSKLNDYKLLLSGYELVKTKQNEQLKGSNYLDCLYYCENNDNCLTVSYCTGGNGECTISSQSADSIISDPMLKNMKTSCKILSKTFIDFFNRLPGRSLVRNPQAISSGYRKLNNLDRESCAKACLDEHSFICEAFDFCDPENHHSFVCFLHVFHIFENTSDNPYTWDSNNTRCDHYTRKLSMDYKQFVGMKFTEGPVIATTNDNSLENCASACNQAEEGCDSFEYCQPLDSIPNISSCRLSSNRVIDDISNLEPEASCSVYGIVRSELRNQVYVMKRNLNVHLAFTCGIMSFLFGVLISASMTYYFMRNKKRVRV